MTYFIDFPPFYKSEAAIQTFLGPCKPPLSNKLACAFLWWEAASFNPFISLDYNFASNRQSYVKKKVSSSTAAWHRHGKAITEFVSSRQI